MCCDYRDQDAENVEQFMGRGGPAPALGRAILRASKEWTLHGRLSMGRRHLACERRTDVAEAKIVRRGLNVAPPMSKFSAAPHASFARGQGCPRPIVSRDARISICQQ